MLDGSLLDGNLLDGSGSSPVPGFVPGILRVRSARQPLPAGSSTASGGGFEAVELPCPPPPSVQVRGTTARPSRGRSRMGVVPAPAIATPPVRPPSPVRVRGTTAPPGNGRIRIATRIPIIPPPPPAIPPRPVRVHVATPRPGVGRIRVATVHPPPPAGIPPRPTVARGNPMPPRDGRIRIATVHPMPVAPPAQPLAPGPVRVAPSSTRRLPVGRSRAIRGIVPVILPDDFLSALVAAWSGDSSLASLSPELYLGVAPAVVWPDGSSYPYATIGQVGSKHGGRNTRVGYWEDTTYQVNVFHPDATQAVALGEAMIAALDPILDQKLLFMNGYQMTWYSTGGHLLKVPGDGAAGHPYVYMQSYTYRVKIGRSRAS